jgi:hypothetical protein
MAVTQIISRNVKDGTVDTADLKDGSVTNAKLAGAVVGLTNLTALTTKGDVLVFDTAHNRLGVGSDGQRFVADSAQAAGVRWATVYTGVKNLLVNGNFDLWQRGTSGSPGVYIADRWKLAGASAGTTTGAQDATNVPDSLTTYSFKLTVGATGSVVAGTNLFLEQPVEGLSFQQSAGKALTLTFWVRSNKTGTYCVAFQNSAGDRSYVATYTISASNTWEKKTITVTHNTTGTWLYDTGAGLRVRFVLAAGSTYQTTAGSWQAGNFLATSAQVNIADSTSNQWDIARVQLEQGDVASDFEQRPAALEYALAARYYFKTYDLTVAPGTVTQTGFITFAASGTGGDQFIHSFPVRMRATPTLTSYSPETGTSGKVRDYGINADQTSSPLSSGSWGIRGVSGAFVDQRIYGLQYTADAEL